MKYSTSTDKELKKSALYQVWCDMLRSARRETEFYTRHGFAKPYRVDEEFREFDTFALWAKFNQGYEIGRDDHKQLARRDIHETFNPDNCYFCERQDYVKELDVLKYEITKGASGVIYKDGKFAPKWNGQSKTRLYNIWKTTCRACSDPGQKDYARLGGKGIRVQEEWRKDYLAFEDWAWEHGYTDELSLVRIDKDKDFTPNNCRWETKTERRCSNLRCYEKIRLSVKRMREYLEKVDDLAICTLIIAPRHVMPIDGEQDDLEPTPVEYRIDKVRS